MKNKDNYVMDYKINFYLFYKRLKYFVFKGCWFYHATYILVRREFFSGGNKNRCVAFTEISSLLCISHQSGVAMSLVSS